MGALRTVYVELALKVQGFKTGITEARDGVQGLVSELDKAAKAGKLDHLAGQATKFGLALSGAFVAVEMAAAKFEAQMSKVKAVTNANASEFENLRQAALKAGRDTVFTSVEAAQAEEELAKAGISTADILGGALTGALSLASAGSLDLAEAADVAAKTMNIFKLHGQDVAHIADVLSASANKSATDVHEIGFALKMSGLAASAAGMQLEETVGTLSAFADRALVGSDAGTSLKQMLMMLQTPTTQASALMKQLGINAYDVSGNFIGTAKLAGILQKQLSGLTQEQRNAALGIIFGSDAMRAANVLYEVGEKGVRDYTDAVNDQGAAARAAATKMDNLMGDIQFLKGSLESLFITSGSGANQGLRLLVKGLEGLVSVFAALPPFLTSGAVLLAGVGGAALLALSAFIKMRSATTSALDELRKIGPAGEKAAIGLERTAKWAGRVGMAFIALQVVGQVASSFNSAVPEIDALSKSLEGLSKNVDSEALKQLFGGNDNWAERFRHDLKMVRNGMEDARNAANIESTFGLSGFSFSTAKSIEELDALDKALTNLVNNGNLEAARAAYARLVKESGKSQAELAAILPGYSAAIAEAERKTRGAALAQQQSAETLDVMTGGMFKAISAGKTLAQVFDEINGRATDWAQAEIKVESAIDNLTKSSEANGKTLDVTTEKGRQNKTALIDLAKASVDAAQKKYEETGSLQEAVNVYDLYIGKLRETLIHQGYTKDQAEQLILTFARMPTLVAPEVQAPGLSKVLADAQALRYAIENLAGATVRANIASGAARGYRWGGVTPIHAREGLLSQGNVFNAGSRPLYAFAEPETGQEAFVPRNGNAGRSMGILQTAAGWYGHTLVPASQGAMSGASGGSAAPVVMVTVSAKDGASQFLADMIDVKVETKFDRETAAVRGGPR